MDEPSPSSFDEPLTPAPSPQPTVSPRPSAPILSPPTPTTPTVQQKPLVPPRVKPSNLRASIPVPQSPPAVVGVPTVSSYQEKVVDAIQQFVARQEKFYRDNAAEFGDPDDPDRYAKYRTAPYRKFLRSLQAGARDLDWVVKNTLSNATHALEGDIYEEKDAEELWNNLADLQESLLRIKGEQTENPDWRPSETIPEDYYS